MEVVAAGEDPNPLRYSGEYWDEETQSYYLRARYYDPVYGRFTQQDQVPYVSRKLPNGATAIDPLSLNLYTYCANNPIAYCDPSGNVWETVLDFVSLGSSIITFQSDPTLLNAAYLLWDIGGLAVPILPGSYVAKGARLAGVTDDATDGLKLIDQIDNYVDIVTAVTKRPDSKMLRIALESAGETAPDFYAAHHIVAGGAKGAVQARMTLAKFGIDINDAANGVFLPTVKDMSDAAYHPSLHTKKYYAAVNKALEKVTSKEEVVNVLNGIARELLNGTFPD